MARTRYKQKPLFWYCVQYTGSNAAEMVDFCPLCVLDGTGLKFNMIPVDPTSWVLEDQGGGFSMMIHSQFVVFFQLDQGPV
jgi:hypothetical protein